jgi:hypothetical protein
LPIVEQVRVALLQMMAEESSNHHPILLDPWRARAWSAHHGCFVGVEVAGRPGGMAGA